MVTATFTNDQARALLQHLADTTPAKIPPADGGNASKRLVHDAFDILAVALVAATKDTSFLPIDPNFKKL